MSDSRGGMSDNPCNTYLRDAVMTATPEQLQLMLYDGAIRFARQARDALQRRDYETSCERLTRAQHIILEMLSGLNYDVNRELCERVASLYNFLYRKLVDACVEHSTAHVDDALKVLRLERETWQLLVDRLQRDRDLAAAGDAPPGGEAAATDATDTPRLLVNG